jgi:hypothetical protein
MINGMKTSIKIKCFWGVCDAWSSDNPAKPATLSYLVTRQPLTASHTFMEPENSYGTRIILVHGNYLVSWPPVYLESWPWYQTLRFISTLNVPMPVEINGCTVTVQKYLLPNQPPLLFHN